MTHPGREDLRAWLNAQPTNFFTTGAALQRGLQIEWVDERFAAERERLNDRLGNLPRLDPYSPIGEQTESVEFHPSYHVAGQAAYEIVLTKRP